MFPIKVNIDLNTSTNIEIKIICYAFVANFWRSYFHLLLNYLQIINMSILNLNHHYNCMFLLLNLYRGVNNPPLRKNWLDSFLNPLRILKRRMIGLPSIFAIICQDQITCFIQLIFFFFWSTEINHEYPRLKFSINFTSAKTGLNKNI